MLAVVLLGGAIAALAQTDGACRVAPLVVVSGGARVINPALTASHIAVIKDTHGKTSHLSASDIEALAMYLKSLQK
jgi:hypothetical protein